MPFLYLVSDLLPNFSPLTLCTYRKLSYLYNVNETKQRNEMNQAAKISEKLDQLTMMFFKSEKAGAMDRMEQFLELSKDIESNAEAIIKLINDHKNA